MIKYKKCRIYTFLRLRICFVMIIVTRYKHFFLKKKLLTVATYIILQYIYIKPKSLLKQRCMLPVKAYRRKPA